MVSLINRRSIVKGFFSSFLATISVTTMAGQSAKASSTKINWYDENFANLHMSEGAEASEIFD